MATNSASVYFSIIAKCSDARSYFKHLAGVQLSDKLKERLDGGSIRKMLSPLLLIKDIEDHTGVGRYGVYCAQLHSIETIMLRGAV